MCWRTNLLVTACLVAIPAQAQLINCPLAYRFEDDTKGGVLVAMTTAERKAFATVDIYAREQSKGDKATYLRIVGDALHMMSEPRTADKTPPPPAMPSASPSPPAARSADEIVAMVKFRNEFRNVATAEGKAGTSSAPSASIEIAGVDGKESVLQSQSELEITAALALDGIRPKALIGQPIQSIAFQSSIAIVDPATFDDPELRKTMGPRAVCSGTRISATAILTAAHCVCDLKLDSVVREVRIGNNSNPNQFPFKAGTLPGKTRCFSGSGLGSDCNSAFCNAYKNNDRNVDASHFGRDLAIVAVDGEQMKGVSEAWSRTSGVAHSDWYRGKVSGSAERHFILGFGFNPKVAMDAGLGVKRCGQMVAGPTCSGGGELPCGAGGELTLIGDPNVSTLTDACPGDSGGGAFLMETSGDSRRFFLAGVVSRGPRYPNEPIWQQCGTKGSIYSFASNPAALEWIKGVVDSFGETLVIKK